MRTKRRRFRDKERYKWLLSLRRWMTALEASRDMDESIRLLDRFAESLTVDSGGWHKASAEIRLPDGNEFFGYELWPWTACAAVGRKVYHHLRANRWSRHNYLSVTQVRDPEPIFTLRK